MAGCADDVAAWLDKLGLNEYTEKFLTAGYSSLQQCVTLSKDDLSAIGIGKVGHVNRLFRDLEKMKVEMSPSPPSSSPPSPLPDLPPSFVKSAVPPTVPPRRVLHKPKSDGNIVDIQPPPKVMPRKASLRKSMSAQVIQPLKNTHIVIDEKQVNSSTIPSSQSLNDILSESQPPDSKSKVTRIPPPVVPSKPLQYVVCLAHQIIWEDVCIQFCTTTGIRSEGVTACILPKWHVSFQIRKI